MSWMECKKGENVVFTIFEESMEAIARHVLLLCTMMDGQQSIEKRVERFLDLYANIRIHSDTETYLSETQIIQNMNRVDLQEKLSLHIENVVHGKTVENFGWISDRFDFSQLSFHEKDKLSEIFRFFSAPKTVSNREDAFLDILHGSGCLNGIYLGSTLSFLLQSAL